MGNDEICRYLLRKQNGIESGFLTGFLMERVRNGNKMYETRTVSEIHVSLHSVHEVECIKYTLINTRLNFHLYFITDVYFY